MRTWLTVIGIGLLMAVTLLLIAGSVAAGPPAQSPDSTTAVLAGPVASKISYQGRLTDPAGNPLSGNYNLVFQLWDAPTAGSQVGSDIVKNSVPVNNGLFTTDMDVQQLDFNGQALWLRVQVNGQWLSPRQELLPVPYALSLRPGAQIGANNSSAVLMAANQGTGTAISAFSSQGWGLDVSSSENVGIYASSGTIPLILITGKQAVVAYGEDNGVIAWGGQTGGSFEGSTSVKGTGGLRGVHGLTESTEEGAAGVFGESTNMLADGVRGQGAHGIHGIGFTGVFGEGDVGVSGAGMVGVGGESESNGGAGPGDPTWVLTDISWSTDPDVWEAARAELADIIEGVSSPTNTPTPTPTPTTTGGSPTATPTATITPTSTPTPTATADQSLGLPEVAGCAVFPADNIWNVPVDTLPVDPNSAAYIATIGAGAGLHPDFGSGDWPPGSGSPIGIPYTDVPGSQPKVAVTFNYADESDAGPYPIPPGPPIEGGPNSNGDRHVLIVDRDHCVLYELYDAWPQADGSWQAGSGAIFDLNSNTLRTAGWTSADAAGLPILAGLVRYDEVASGEIHHAIRVTAPQTRREYIWPARHFASSLTGTQYPPMGQRFRLRADFDSSGFSPEVQVILQAFKKYGMILADNGASWFISGAPDERWNNGVLVPELRQVKGSDFEAVDVSSLMVDPHSAQVQWPASQCVGDVNGNGLGDVADIMATADRPGCVIHLPLVIARWRQPW